MKALTVSLALFSVGCIVALAWVLGTPAPIDPRVAKRVHEGLRRGLDLKDARQTIAQLRRDLAVRPTALPSPSTAVVASAVAITGDSAKAPAGAAALSPFQAGGGKGGASALREMLKNPGMRAMMEQQQAVQVETSYARLFDQLQLTDEEKTHFKKLLTDRQKAETDLGLKLLDPNLTPQDKQQIMAQAEKNKKTYDDAIKTFMNNDSDFGTFQNWEDTKPERTLYDTVGRNLFASSNEPLSAQQEQVLLNTMTQIRKSPTAEQAAVVKTMQDPTQMNDANIQRMLQMTDANNKRILEQAATSLTPGQLKTLENYLQQSRSMTITGLEMGKMMMQGGK